jgi:DNA (cytosine-5)-methyltransferase 1
MNELALFSGAGGGILGGHLLGWRTVCAVEWEEYPASVLCARQNDKILPTFPIWDDVRTFDGRPWRGIVDVISGGFPCQDISVAGRGDGLDGERSGMWKEMARIIGEVRPQFAFVENSPMLVTRGLERVVADLTKMGYDSRWGIISASDIGANHKRERIWIVAHSKHGRYTDQVQGKHGEEVCVQGEDRTQWSGGGLFERTSGVEQGGFTNRVHDQNNVAYTRDIRPCSSKTKQGMGGEIRPTLCGVDKHWWDREPQFTPRTTQPELGGVVDGVGNRVDRLKAIGNGQVPLCVAKAWKLLTSDLKV